MLSDRVSLLLRQKRFIPASIIRGLQVLHVLANPCVFLCVAILIHMKWHLIVALLCITLMVNVLPIFLCGLGHLEKCPFKSFVHFLIVLLFKNF